MVPLFGNMPFFFIRLPMNSLRVRPRVLVLRQSEIDVHGFTPIPTFPLEGEGWDGGVGPCIKII